MKKRTVHIQLELRLSEEMSAEEVVEAINSDLTEEWPSNFVRAELTFEGPAEDFD